jgi:hypothetical protein
VPGDLLFISTLLWGLLGVVPAGLVGWSLVGLLFLSPKIYFTFYPLLPAGSIYRCSLVLLFFIRDGID